MGQIDVAIIDDQTIFRESVAHVLEADSRFRVLGDFHEGRAGIDACIARPPAVVLVDMVLPDMSGVDVVRELRRDLPRTAIVVITAHPRAALVRETFELGVHGIVMKGSPLRSLIEALVLVAEGGTYYCKETAEMLREIATRQSQLSPLTPRQRAILQRVAQGLSSKEIAAELELSVKTVVNHRHEIRRRLGLTSVASLTRYAVEQGLIEAPSLGDV